MDILFCGLKNEYGNPSSGLSFEYKNLFQPLQRMTGITASFFATDDGLNIGKRDTMNQRLMQAVQEQKPDLLFCFLFTEELKKETIERITKKTGTKTFNWFADDHWRFPIYSKYWAPSFTAVATTDSLAVAKYRSIGIEVIKTQWAAAELGKLESGNVQFSNEISFVGKNYGKREKYIAYLEQQKLTVKAFGKGWEGGVVSDADLATIFSRSRINLNFTESYIDWKKQAVQFFLRKELGNYYVQNHFLGQVQSTIGKMRPQIKSRIFEIPARGGFLLTGEADNLRDYYEEGKEIIIFDSAGDLAEKCRYYLTHEAERAAIAKAGYERTAREHTYEKRFTEIFKKMALW